MSDESKNDQPRMSDAAGPTLPVQPPAWRGWAVLAAALAATILLGLLAASILQRRQEAVTQRYIVPISAEDAMDAAKWGLNYPREYDSYQRMADTSTKTRYGGSSQRDYLAETPANVILFAGYPFAKDYKQARGHVYAIDDVTASPRIGPATPATCFTCKSPDSVRLIGEWGPEKFYFAKFADVRPRITHPIGCYDCHDPKTMRLRVLRPALVEALKRLGRDIEQASHQEMRTLVCAQCHVEYYFRSKKYNYLVFPWEKGEKPEQTGTRPEDMEGYYDKIEFTDWTHAISGASMIKMQHPDYEAYRTGIHAYRDLACADCHMPYRSEGGVKFTDHHLQSPLANISNSCAVCHRWSEAEIRDRVYAIQDKVHECRGLAETAIAQSHFDIAAAMQAGARDDELKDVRRLVRRAQLRWDYVAASNGMGFHSPQECERILTAAVDLAGQCRVECARILGRHGVVEPVEYPDYGSKEKAQALIEPFLRGKTAK